MAAQLQHTPEHAAHAQEPSDVNRQLEPSPPTPTVPLVGDSRGLKPVPPAELWTTGG